MQYSLQKYTTLKSRYECPACRQKHVFAMYVDSNGTQLNNDVGRCNRVGKCNYHKTPKDYFAQNPDFIAPTFEPKAVVYKEPFRINKTDAVKSFKQYQNNNFVQYLCNTFGITEADRLVSMYKIGTSVKWNGANIFWQIDTKGEYRTGKIMLYDVNTCKRVKVPYDMIYWAHRKLLNDETHELKQCLFGLHLINESTKPIAIVESEKTALLMAHYCDKYTWLGAGNINGLSVSKLEPLLNREVMLFPDLGEGYKVWNVKAQGFKNITVNTYIQSIATADDVIKQLDIADFLSNEKFNINMI
jgi:hypothetical protein